MAALAKISKDICKIFRSQSLINLTPAGTITTSEKLHKKETDKKTHTGQQWADDDYRLVRFTNKSKQVNERFAIDLIEQEPPKPVKARYIWCDGGGALGHPKVYINLDPPGNHICGYCGLRYYQQHEH